MDSVTSWLRQYRTLIGIALLIAFWCAVLYLMPVEDLVQELGVQNAYIIGFTAALIAGFSSLTGTAAYAAVIAFSRAGADPLYLGVASGIGLFISDTAFFFLMLRGRESVEDRFRSFLKKVHALIERVPPVVVYVGTYLFCAFGPIPNDVILAALVIAGYRYRRFWLALLLGDVTFMLFLSYLFQQ